MLPYHTQYQVSVGIYTAFSNNSDRRLLTINHPSKKMESMKTRFPVGKYEQFTKENFIVVCLYINFYKSPSSIEDVLKYLLELDFNKDILPFKHKITQYKELLSTQVAYLQDTYGKPSITQIFEAYRGKHIEFYTIWFYLYFLGYNLYETIGTPFNRTQTRELQKIKNLSLYVTFSENSMSYIKTLMSQSDLLGDI